ncbi:hypothetical protein FOYG_05742 [Fusarium oxysporum NRRL 32931]|uniref:DUF6603 domain-containing protein n=1 Tax=Fusarium oxysporum NRRL 32931 TaxID=660029 RepID=W9II09_FUSOX|nr:hypothetical protein FOYG_05742 [Fusarium oxysporum NRRL 32931]
MTPSIAIAGASLHAILDIGVLHAFLDAWVGSLINYQPFMFTSSGGINVGVRYTLDLWFLTIYINIQVGATLFLQGPPFQGVCHVNFWVFGFDIAFGPSDARQTATEEDSSKPQIFTCNSGLVSSMKPEPKDPKEVTKMAHDFVPNSDPPPPVWSVTADTFVFTVTSVFATSSVAITDEKDKETQPQFNAPLNTNPTFAHPMYLEDDEKRI